MTDEPQHTLVVGMTGSGKTTFTIRYLLNVTCACRFLFDDRSRFSRRLRVTPAFTARQVEEALPTRWVIFNPVQMFPDDYAAGFAWFCQWVYECAGRGPGLKVLVVDELWQWADSRAIPRTLRLCTQAGREGEASNCSRARRNRTGSTAASSARPRNWFVSASRSRKPGIASESWAPIRIW